MRIALLSDIHGNLAALEAVERDLRPRGVDSVVNLGDSLSGPLLPRETAEFLMAQDWIHLAGNHERQLLEDPPEGRSPSDAFAHAQLSSRTLEWLASLASVRVLAGELFLCHGTPGSDREHLLATVACGSVRMASTGELDERLAGVEAPLIACGHTHLPGSARSTRGQQVINPGSVGLQAYLDSTPFPYAVETGSPDARYAIVERFQGVWSTEWFSVPYDAEAMARLAKLRSFRHWEGALRTGYLPRDTESRPTLAPEGALP